MIDIIGFISVDETKEERIDYLIASIRSYAFLKDRCKFILALANPSDKLFNMVLREAQSIGFDHNIALLNNTDHYGLKYLELLKKGTNDYVINFMEDQFMVCDSAEYLQSVISTMQKYKADVCKSSFLSIEKNSSGNLVTLQDNDIGKVFVNHDINFEKYKQHYVNRYYIGVNFLTTRKFAEKFWSRELGPRPHEYEVQGFDEHWFHTCLIPKKELQAAIDDDHGDPNSCLLKRGISDAKFKFDDIIKNIEAPHLSSTSLANKENASPLPHAFAESLTTVSALVKGAQAFLKFIFSLQTADNRMAGLFIGGGENLLFYGLLPLPPMMYVFETDPKIYLPVMQKIAALPNYEENLPLLATFTADYSGILEGLANNKYDFLHIEHATEDKIIIALEKLKPGGLLYINNCIGYPFDKMLHSWFRIDTDGMINIADPNNLVFKTTFYLKPAKQD